MTTFVSGNWAIGYEGNGFFYWSDVMLFGMEKLLFFGLGAVILNFAGYVPYIKAILAGVVKPQRVTWGIWTILTTIAFVNQVLNNGGYSALFFGSTVGLVGIVFLLSLVRGVGGASRFDIMILSMSLVLLVFWVIFRESYYSTLFAIAIDAFGAIPTLIKAYKQPQTEVFLQWILSALGGFLSLFAVPQITFILIVYPLYVVVMNGLIVVTKYIGSTRGHDKVKA